MTKKMGKMYYLFDARERIGLVFKAMARDDEPEVNRLMKTCPIYAYESRDQDYRDAAIAATDLVTAFTAQYATLKTATDHLGRFSAFLSEGVELIATIAWLEGFSAGANWIIQDSPSVMPAK